MTGIITIVVEVVITIVSILIITAALKKPDSKVGKFLTIIESFIQKIIP